MGFTLFIHPETSGISTKNNLVQKSAAFSDVTNDQRCRLNDAALRVIRVRGRAMWRL